MEGKTCTNMIGRNLDTGKPILCGQPAPYMVVTTNPELGWAVVDYHCAGCASQAVSRVEAAAIEQRRAATKIS